MEHTIRRITPQEANDVARLIELAVRDERVRQRKTLTELQHCNE